MCEPREVVVIFRAQILDGDMVDHLVIGRGGSNGTAEGGTERLIENPLNNINNKCGYV